MVYIVQCLCLAHLSDSLTNYLWIKTFRCCYRTFVSGSFTTLLQHGIGVDDDDILIYRERKLNEQTGDIVWKPKHSKHTFFAITKKFLMDNWQGKGVLIYKRPYKPDEHPNDHSDTISR